MSQSVTVKIPFVAKFSNAFIVSENLNNSDIVFDDVGVTVWSKIEGIRLSLSCSEISDINLKKIKFEN